MNPAAAPIAPRDDAERSLLVALSDKYDRMVTLRAALGRGTPSPTARELLRALAADFPGALRELETISTAELEARASAAHAARDAAEVPAWLLWTALYHTNMRRLLAARRVPDQARADRTTHGRLNVLVFAALEQRFGVPQREIWDHLFPTRGAAPRPYR